MKTNLLQNIPDGWNDVVASIVLDVRDGTHDTPAKVADGIPLITSKNIINGDLDITDSYFVSKEDAEQINKRSRVEKGDILISMIGTVGECALLKTQPNFVVKNVGIFKKNENNVISEYLIKYLHSHISQHRVRSHSNGGIQKFISLGDLRKLKLLLPPLPEQNRIVFILNTWNQATEKLKRKIEIKKRISLGFAQSILTGKLRLKNFSGNWKQYRLADLAKIYDGTHQTPEYVEKGIPFLSVEHISADNFVDTKYIARDVYEKESKRVKIQKGDILMTRIGSIGAVKYIDWDIDASFYVTLALLKVKDGVDARALSYFMSTAEFQKELWRRTLHVAFPNKINLGDIGKCKIDLPEDIEEQRAIGVMFETIYKEIELLETKLRQVVDQRKYLLNNLVTGTIRTPETLSIPK